jgi:hypothetical protein
LQADYSIAYADFIAAATIQFKNKTFTKDSLGNYNDAQQYNITASHWYHTTV